MKREGGDRELHFKQLMLEQIRLEVQAAAWLVIQQEPASIQLVGLPEKVLRAGETGAMLDVIREIYRLEEVVIKNNKKPEKYSGFLLFYYSIILSTEIRRIC